MTSTIIIESNRKIAYNQLRSTNETIDNITDETQYNEATNKWKTFMSSGIPVNVGDQINVEAAMINSIGSGDEMIEFTGETGNLFNNRPIRDNKSRLTLGFYISNLYQFLFNLPKSKHLINTHPFQFDYGGPLWDDIGVSLPANYPNKIKQYYLWNQSYPNDAIEGFLHDDKVIRNYTYISNQPTDIYNPQYIEGALSKSSSSTFRPNQKRFYIGEQEYDGPYYATQITEIESKNNGWKMYTSDIDLEIKKGFTTPANLANQITGQLHKRQGSTIQPVDIQNQALQYTIDLVTGEIKQLIMPAVTDSTYQTFRTSTGDPFYRRSIHGVTGIQGWASAFKGEKDAAGTAILRGTNFIKNQGRRAFWSSLCCANLRQWKAISNLLPFLQQGAFVVNNANPYNPLITNHMLYTGGNTQFDETNRNNGTINIGEFGGFPCILDNVLKFTFPAVHSFANRNNTNTSNLPDSVNVNTASRPLANIPIWDLRDKAIIPLNIIFSVKSINKLKSLYNDAFYLNGRSTNQNEFNQDFMDTHRVKYTLGRIDDQVSNPSAKRYIYLPPPKLIFEQQLGGSPYLESIAAPTNLINAEKSYSRDITFQLFSDRATTIKAPRLVGINAQNYDIEVYRFGNLTDYNVQNAINNTIPGATNLYPHNPDSLFTTCPPDNNSLKLQELYNLIQPIQNSIKNRGIGIIPVFYKASFPGLHPTLLNVPFIGIISAPPIIQFIPYPSRGEYLSIGSPCLLQNFLGKIISTQKTDTTTYRQYVANSVFCDPQQYMPYIYCGAVDSEVSFNDASRFSISQFHTAIKQGNGIFQDMNPVISNQAQTDILINKFSKGALCALSNIDEPTGYNNISSQGGVNDSILSSQSGVSIIDLKGFYSNSDTDTFSFTQNLLQIYDDTLFQKCGFELEQLKPQYGFSNALFNRGNYNIFIGNEANIFDKQENMVMPFTTNAYLSSAEMISLVQGLRVKSTNAPSGALETGSVNSANLGGLMNIQSETEATSDELAAYNLPKKLDYPYLVVYSDIVTNPLYYGGADGRTKLKAIAYITRNYAEGDFFYSFATSWAYTVDKDYVITDITTDIRLPDGRPAPIDENSSIIYKIVQPLVLPPPPDIIKQKK